jgi:hypothetical protein
MRLKSRLAVECELVGGVGRDELDLVSKRIEKKEVKEACGCELGAWIYSHKVD